MPYKILVADDEPDTLDLCSKILKREGFEVSTVKDGIEAIKMIEKEPFDLLLLDIRMPGKNGMEVLDVATTNSLDTIMITAYATVGTAVEAMKKGAKDYLTKPFTSVELRSVVEKVFFQQRVLDTKRYLEKRPPGFSGLVGESPPMQKLYELIERIADTDVNILIEGESGTGKELVARAIHQKSRRREKPFIPINCGSIPESLLESELFGHTKGAFTGSVDSKLGLFEAASEGSVFLDEIAEMSPALQVKLLRVIQDKEIRRVGAIELKRINVRIIAATNKELSREAFAGRFREDLFYRLSVISLRLPPLRERKEDIPLLVHHFINRFNIMYNKQIEGAAPQAMQQLLEYPWPGNVRELENMMERAAILVKGKIILPRGLFMGGKGYPHLPPEAMGHYKSLEEMEKEHIETVLKAAKGNRTVAARILGIGRRTLYDKIVAYGIKESNEK